MVSADAWVEAKSVSAPEFARGQRVLTATPELSAPRGRDSPPKCEARRGPVAAAVGPSIGAIA
jgi:hypothetical protein